MTQEARAAIQQHSKSFALASKVLGARLRDDTSVVYAWCRRTDDAIDELPRERAAELPATLERLTTELTHAYAGDVDDAQMAAFGAIARARRIPRRYPEELIEGMAMDARGTHYRSVDDVLLYGWRVAGVVGLMMSHVFGVADDAALPHAAHLGLGMQLTNICRDVAEDWERGRLYLPADLLARHGAADLAADLGKPLPTTALPAISKTVEELLAVAERYYRSGDRGIRYLPWRAALAVSAARRIYAAIGIRIAATGYDVTACRAVVSHGAKLAHVTAAATRLLMSSPGRALAGVLRSRPVRIPDVTLELADAAL